MKLFLHSHNGTLSYINNKGSIVTSTLNDLPSSEACYLVATKENLKLLPFLLEVQYKASPKIKTFLGNTRNVDTTNSSTVLKQMLVMSPVIATPYTWLPVTERLMQTVDVINGASDIVRERHYLEAYLNFVGLRMSDNVVKLLSFVVDPRWFIKSNGKTSGAIHYFGLDKPSKSRLDRRKLVQAIYDSRVNNVLDGSKAPLKYTIHYILKIWLQYLDSNFEFKPELFFKDKIVLEKFYAKFGE